MLSTHLDVQEIGERLGVSRYTVKSHTIAIYGKLAVSSRSEAIARAIEIGLLEPSPAPSAEHERGGGLTPSTSVRLPEHRISSSGHGRGCRTG